MKKGIIFDMDGTLWDSAAEVAESWNETVKRAGYDRKPITVKDIQSVMGKTMDVIARILFPDLEEGERQKLLAQCGEEENDYLRIHGATLYPDIRRTMEQLKKKYHLYIVSNCQSGYIEAFLDYYKPLRPDHSFQEPPPPAGQMAWPGGQGGHLPQAPSGPHFQ